MNLVLGLIAGALVRTSDGPERLICEVVEAARAALAPLLPDKAALRSLLESAERDALEHWFGEAPRPASASPREESPDELLADLAFSLRPEQRAAFELAAGCARYFDVEEVLSDEVVEVNARKVRPVPRQVPYPTQNMTFERTGGLHDVHRFVLSDPRMLLYDLAAHRQLVRAYLEDEPPPERQKKKRTAVRVYVCDASDSMHGPRARFRDALIIGKRSRQPRLPFPDDLYGTLDHEQLDYRRRVYEVQVKAGEGIVNLRHVARNQDGAVAAVAVLAVMHWLGPERKVEAPRLRRWRSSIH